MWRLRKLERVRTGYLVDKFGCSQRIYWLVCYLIHNIFDSLTELLARSLIVFFMKKSLVS